MFGEAMVRVAGEAASRPTSVAGKLVQAPQGTEEFQNHMLQAPIVSIPALRGQAVLRRSRSGQAPSQRLCTRAGQCTGSRSSSHRIPRARCPRTGVLRAG